MNITPIHVHLPDGAVRAIVKNTIGIGEETCEITIEHRTPTSPRLGGSNGIGNGPTGYSGNARNGGGNARNGGVNVAVNVLHIHGEDWVTKKQYDWLMDKFLHMRDAAENHEKAFLAESQRTKKLARRLAEVEAVLTLADTLAKELHSNSSYWRSAQELSERISQYLNGKD